MIEFSIPNLVAFGMMAIGVAGAVAVLAVILIHYLDRVRPAPLAIPAPRVAPHVLATRDLHGLSREEFQAYFAAIFQRRGYKVTYTTYGLRLRHNGETTLAMLHHIPNAARVIAGQDRVTALRDLLDQQRVTHGMLVTLGIYTTEAIEHAARDDVHQITLYDGPGVQALAEAVQLRGQVHHAQG